VTLTNRQSWNRYAYVNNNPLALIDPLGLDDESDCPLQDDSGDCDDDNDDNSDGGGRYDNGDCPVDACVTATLDPVQTEDSPLTCTTIAMEGPVGPNGPVSVADNIQQGQQEQSLAEQSAVLSGQESIMLNVWLYGQFATGGPQDYKNQPWGGQGYVDFGNFNYGAVCGAVGFSLTYCQSAAGGNLIGRAAYLNVQNAANNYLAGAGAIESGIYSPSQRGASYNGSGVPLISAPYGDQAGDSEVISQGYAFQAQDCD
jgi:hypothetical protein